MSGRADDPAAKQRTSPAQPGVSPLAWFFLFSSFSLNHVRFRPLFDGYYTCSDRERTTVAASNAIHRVSSPSCYDLIEKLAVHIYLRARVAIEVSKPVRRGVLLKAEKDQGVQAPEWFDAPLLLFVLWSHGALIVTANIIGSSN